MNIKEVPRLSLKILGHNQKVAVRDENGKRTTKTIRKLQEVYPMIVAVVTKACVNRTDQDAGSSSIEDFVSSAVIRVLEAYPRYNPKWRLSTFLFPNIKGEYYGLMRKEMKNVTTCIQHDPLELPDVPYYDQFIAKVDGDSYEDQVYPALYRAIRNLSFTQRAVVIGRFFNGMSLDELAESLWISKMDVKLYLKESLQSIKMDVEEVYKADYPNRTLHSEGRRVVWNNSNS